MGDEVEDEKQTTVRIGMRGTVLNDPELDRISFPTLASTAGSAAPPARLTEDVAACFEPGKPRDWRCILWFGEGN